MKKIFFVMLMLCCALGAVAQQIGFTYQAVALDESKAEGFGRDSKGQILLNQPLKVRFSIHEQSADGTVQYQEVHETTTDIFGIFRVVIGSGEKLQGTSLEELRWSDQSYFMQVEVDLGNGFVSMGTEVIVVPPFGLNNTNQLLNLAGTQLSISDGNSLDLSNLLGSVRLSEQEVDAYVANNGYLLTEVDGSVTNEIQDLQLSGNQLIVTNNPNATVIDLSPYLDDNLTEHEVDDMVGNNGYLTSEVDGSITNEIQDLNLTGNTLSITNNASSTNIDLGPYRNVFEITNGVTSNENGSYATDDFVFGSSSLDHPAVEGQRDRIFFDKSKGAFRAGSTNDASWNDSNRGFYSTAFGFNNIALGVSSFAAGENNNSFGASSTSLGIGNTSGGSFSFSAGTSNTASGYSSFAAGFVNSAAGYNAFALGDNSSALGDYSKVFAHNSTAYSYGETVLGTLATEYTPVGDVTAIDRLFTIGNGMYDFNSTPPYSFTRSDALVMLKNGNTRLHGQLTIDADNVNGAGEPYTLPGQDGAANQVMTTDGNGNVSWNTPTTLTETDVDNFVSNNGYLTTEVDGSTTNEIQDLALNGNTLNITNNPTATNIDLSAYQNVFERNNGVISNENGNYATDDFVFGMPSTEFDFNNTQELTFFFDKSKGAFRAGIVTLDVWNDSFRGYGSFAMGMDTRANGGLSLALGQLTTASGSRSMAAGIFSLAAGENSVAFGNRTLASGFSSTAIGYDSNAGGNSSFAQGRDTDASGPYSVALGNNTTASGEGALAGGNQTLAFGSNSAAFGFNSAASGLNSLSSGNSCLASGDNSIALGNLANATGANSVAINGGTASGLGAIAFMGTASGSEAISLGGWAIGEQSIALFGGQSTHHRSFSLAGFASAPSAVTFGGYAFGRNSFSAGAFTSAASFSEFACGSYNTTYSAVNAASSHHMDRLFVIGNGVALNSRSDALVMLKNGNTRLHGQLTIDADNVGGAGGSYTFPGQRGTNGQVMVTNGSGVLSWSTLPIPTITTTSNVSSNANGNYAADDFVFGSFQLDDTGNPNHDSRVFFDKSSGAFRAGRVTDDSWNSNNRGNGSIGLGANVIASGTSSVSIGYFSSATGEHAVALGYGGVASGTRSLSLGYGTASGSSSLAFHATASGQESMAFLAGNASGYRSISIGGGGASGNHSISFHSNASGTGAISFALNGTAQGNYSLTHGYFSIARSFGETALGFWNTDTPPFSINSRVDGDKLFSIGNGTVFTRSDALVMLKNGNTRLHGQLTIDADNVNGPGLSYTLPGQRGTNGQILSTDANGNVGWINPQATLTETDVDNFVSNNGYLTSETQDLNLTGNILSITNNDAATYIDLTPYQNVFETTNGVTSNENGSYTTDSFVIGSPSLDDDGDASHDTRMFFEKSTGAFRVGTVEDFEWNTTQRGINSIAMGNGNIARGNYSLSLGLDNLAHSASSVAIGTNNIAEGYNSIALGRNVSTTGLHSMAFSFYSAARSFGETTMGMFATDYVPNAIQTFDLNDRLFTIGNGTADAARSNALVVYKNGDATLLGTLTDASDLRLKRNIKPLQNSLYSLSKLKGVHYQWNGRKPQDTVALQTGLIAQEVEKIFPELVKTDEEGFKSVNYIGLVPHLIEAIKELKIENEELKSETEKTKISTEQKIAEMEAKLMRIEALVEKVKH